VSVVDAVLVVDGGWLMGLAVAWWRLQKDVRALRDELQQRGAEDRPPSPASLDPPSLRD